jgi:hypothetical protein
VHVVPLNCSAFLALSVITFIAHNSTCTTLDFVMNWNNDKETKPRFSHQISTWYVRVWYVRVSCVGHKPSATEKVKLDYIACVKPEVVRELPGEIEDTTSLLVMYHEVSTIISLNFPVSEGREESISFNNQILGSPEHSCGFAVYKTKG